jgi:hypothetical protein
MKLLPALLLLAALAVPNFATAQTAVAPICSSPIQSEFSATSRTLTSLYAKAVTQASRNMKLACRNINKKSSPAVQGIEVNAFRGTTDVVSYSANGLSTFCCYVKGNEVPPGSSTATTK